MFQDFFRGRYGIDILSIVLIIASILLLKHKYFWIAGVAILALVIFRALSRNISRRYEELRRFKELMSKTGRFLRNVGAKLENALWQLNQRTGYLFARVRQRKDYVFVKCPKCRNTLRLPKNRGKLQVKCPVCKNEFIKKT